MIDMSQAKNFALYSTTYSTATSLATEIPTATRPTGGIELAEIAGVVSNNVVFMFVGTDAANETFTYRITGWGQDSQPVYYPTTLVEGVATLGAKTGVSGYVPANTTFFADTLTITKGNAGVDCQAISPADDTVASLIVDAKGFSLLTIAFNTGSSAASMGAMWKAL